MAGQRGWKQAYSLCPWLHPASTDGSLRSQRHCWPLWQALTQLAITAVPPDARNITSLGCV